MNLNSLKGITPSVAETGMNSDDVVELAMLKKAIDVESSVMTQTLEAVPAPVRAQNLPPNLGRNVNTTA